MRRNKSDDYKKLVPLKRMAEASSYSLGYVSILVQRKKLKAKKIGNKYFTTREWFDQYLEAHARDEKRLPAEAVSELAAGGAAGAKPESQATASVNLKSRIDNLVEQAIKEKMSAAAKGKKEQPAEAAVKKIARQDARRPAPAERRPLEEILSEKIPASPARLVADLVEPEKRLAGEWRENLVSGEKELKSEVKKNSKKSFSFKINLSGYKSSFKKFWIPAGVYPPKWRAGMTKRVSGMTERVAGMTKIIGAAAAVLLITFALINFAPRAAVNLSQNLKRNFSPLEAKLEKSNYIIPGGALIARAGEALDRSLLALVDRTAAASLELENNLKRRNKILAGRLGAVTGQAAFIADFWGGRLDGAGAGLTSAARLIPAKAKQSGGGMLAILKSFITFQGRSAGEVARLAREALIPDQAGDDSPATGRVAGVMIAADEENNSLARLLALANTTSRRGQEVINQVKYSAGGVLTDSTERQKDLSLSLGNKLALLTEATADKLSGYNRSGQTKLATLENSIDQTNQAIAQSSLTGQSYLAQEAERSIWSLGNLYSRLVDFIIPDALKNKYASLYQQPPAETKTIVERETVIREVAAPQPAASSQQPAASSQDTTSQTSLVSRDSANLSITGNADIGGQLNVSGPAVFKNKLSVAGQSEFLGDVTVNAALTAKTLLVTDYAQFNGAISAKAITADSLTARNDLTVVGNSFIGGNELVSGNLKVAGTLSAGHTEFSSLGVTGQLGASSLSAGTGGLVVGGNANFNGDSNLFAGNVTINNILNVSKETPAAFTVGDGSTNNFTVNTKDDAITISASLNLSGSTAFSGSMNLDGALDLDTASTSALTVGDGVDDNLIIDTVNDILTLGYSSTTDQINLNAKQLAMNFASSTAGILINYDGTGNIMQIVDNGVVRHTLADNGNIIQTASTTGYAYVLNQAGTNGNLLEVQDESVARFAIADLGVTALTASSTAGTALTVRQDGAGDILNLYDGGTEVLTVLDGGNVGIGTTSPASLLHLAGTTEQLRLGFDGQNYTALTVSADGALQIAPTNSATTTVSSAFAAASSLYVLNNGNIGIGTSVPARKLEIADSAYRLLRLTSSDVIGSVLEFNPTAAGGDAFEIGSMADGAAKGGGRFAFVTGGAAGTIMVMETASGNIGIASTSPASKLSIIGDSYFTGNHYQQGNATTTGNFYIGSNLTVAGNSTVIGASSADSLSIVSSITSDLIPDLNASRDLGSAAFYWDDLYIDNVIANNLSAASSSVAGTNAATFTINADNGTADNEDADLIFYRGTVVPNALLSWKSAIDRFEFNQPLYISDDSLTGATSTLLVQGFTGQSGDVFRVASSSSENNSYFNVTAGGNVGIGTADPLGVFHVSSETGSTMFFDRYGAAPPNIIFRRANGTMAAPTAVGLDNQLFALGGRGYGATDFSSGGRAAIFAAAAESWTDAAQGAYLAFNTTLNGTAAAAERMRIADSGFIGIGTTSPYAKLSVAGRGVFDQDIRFDYFTATSSSATSTIAGGFAVK
ncbi:MAG: hypothetical protein Q8O93_02710, partial [bacterium]|nr:hypothetical protein [bacterium]